MTDSSSETRSAAVVDITDLANELQAAFAFKRRHRAGRDTLLSAGELAEGVEMARVILWILETNRQQAEERAISAREDPDGAWLADRDIDISDLIDPDGTEYQRIRRRRDETKRQLAYLDRIVRQTEGFRDDICRD